MQNEDYRFSKKNFFGVFSNQKEISPQHRRLVEPVTKIWEEEVEEDRQNSSSLSAHAEISRINMGGLIWEDYYGRIDLGGLIWEN